MPEKKRDRPETKNYIRVGGNYSANLPPKPKDFPQVEAKKYKVFYHANAGGDDVRGMPESHILEGFVSLKEPKRDGHIFMGWSARNNNPGRKVTHLPGAAVTPNKRCELRC